MSEDTEPSSPSSLAYTPPESYDLSGEKKTRLAPAVIVGILLLFYACGLQWLIFEFTPALLPPKRPTYTTGTGSSLLILVECFCVALFIGAIGLFYHTRWSRPLAAALLVIIGLLILAIMFSTASSILALPGIIIGFLLIYLLVLKPLIGLLD